MTAKHLFGHIVLAIISLLTAFFLVFNVVFSDIFGTSGLIQAVGLVFLVYTILSIMWHLIWPTRGWSWFLWLTIPATVILVWYTLSEHTRLGYHFAVLAAVLFGSYIGRFIHRSKASSPAV